MQDSCLPPPPNASLPPSPPPQANNLFGQVVLSAYKPGDMVWVQDYHLMLLPSILKQQVPRMKVGTGTYLVPAAFRCRTAYLFP